MSDDRKQLQALILENMIELEDSYREFSALETEVFAEMDAIVREWARTNGWFGTFEYLTHGLKLAPEAWRVQADAGKPVAKAWFYFGYAEADDQADYKWSLTRLCYLRGDPLVLAIWPEWKVAGFKAAVWKGVARENAQILEAVGYGVGSAGEVFQSVKVDVSELAQGVRTGSISEALQPWRNALERLPAVVPIIDTVLEHAIQQADR